MKGAFVLLVVLGIAICAQSLPNVSNIDYGLGCNETFTCDAKKLLTCSSNKFCQCLNPETMIYDQELLSCVALAEAPCFIDYPVDLPKANLTESENPAQLELQCVKNAVCDPLSKICGCDGPFVASNDGSCIIKSLFNETCSSSVDCREDLGLICDQSLCTCDPEKAFHNGDVNPDGCVGQAGKSCVLDMCTANAKCQVQEKEGESESVSENGDTGVPSASAPKICVCEDGYRATKLGTCGVKDHGILCDETHACKPWLRCGETGLCECLNPENQVYDETAGKCVSQVRGSCKPGFSSNIEQDNDTCIVGAECVVNTLSDSSRVNENQNNDSYLTSAMEYHCLCMEGYKENGEGGCEIAFGGECKSSADDQSRYSVPCHRDGNLDCKEGKCDCKLPMQRYDEDKERCVGLNGAPCTISYTTSSPDGSNATTSDGCTKGAICKRLETEKEVQDGIEGVCKCVGKKYGDGLCEKKVNANANHIILTASIVVIIALLITVCCLTVKRLKYFVRSFHVVV